MFLALILGVILTAMPVAAPAASAPPSAQSFYSSALGAMSNLPQPAYVAYRLEAKSRGFSINLTSFHHLVWLSFGTGNHPNNWSLLHRTQDYATQIVDERSQRWVSQRAFFDPTWYGAYRALREGMLYYQHPEKPMTARSAPAPTSLKIPTIAVLSVIGPGMYRVQDRGAARCANGDPGHALHLVSRDRSPKHQPDNVIVDLKSMRFCMIRFGVSDAFGFHGVVQENYAEVRGYWVQTGGMIDGTIRLFGVSLHHGVWKYHLANMRFPHSISATTFIPPATQ